MADQTLFDATPYAVEPPAPPAKLSPDRARTLRQTAALAAGRHPLQPIAGHLLRLHPEAAPHDDRTAPGRRCGNCWHRHVLPWHNRTWPKCTYGVANPTDTADGSHPRISHSAASDCRAWWPACTDHSYGDPGVSDDAARWVPEPEATS